MHIGLFGSHISTGREQRRRSRRKRKEEERIKEEKEIPSG